MESVLSSSHRSVRAALSLLSLHSPIDCCPTTQSSRTDKEKRSLPTPVGGRCLDALRLLLFTAGVASFIFSAVSPYDDDIQQEFAQRRFHYSDIIRIAKARPSHLAGNRKIASAVLLASHVSLHQEWELQVMVELNGTGAISVRALGQRSPPRC
jgi:hypothetical protein